MPDHSDDSRAEVQLSFLPHSVLQLTIRLGLVPARNAGQWQYEIHNVESGALIAMTSRHHFHDGNLGAELLDAVNAAIADLELALERFEPFG